MTFDEILAQVRDLLQREGRVSYRALKRRFALDDEYLEDLKAEIIKAKKLAVDEDGEVLVWVGREAKGETEKRRNGETEKKQLTSSDSRLQTLDPRLPSGERRQLTVMFCDLVGSTALSEQLDPEELREIVQAYQEMCAAAIARFEGHLAKYLGDGVLVYFGYPLAHEDDAQRAVRVGLEILASLPQLNARLQHPIRVRIGIHTGLVVTGEMGGGETREPMAIVGETPNIAARLQEIAAPNTVAISAATYRLIEGFFTCQALGAHSIKGLSYSLEVYRVLSESGIQSRFEVAVSAGLTSLVGREQEVGLLLERWERVKEGTGQVVILSGEAGIGKSRLVQTLKECLTEEPQAWLECRCSPYHQNSALYPVIDLLQQVLQFRREESSAEKLSKLEGALASYSLPLEEVVPLFASLLSLPASRFPSPVLTPQRQKQKTLEALLAWVLKEAEKQPLRFVGEDLHWVDPSTLELLDLIINQAPTARILVLLTFRPEFNPPWSSRSNLTQITLGRLAYKQVAAMVEKVARGKALPPEVLHQVAAKTDGVPLFVEELTKMVLESELLKEKDGHYELTDPLPPLAIPATLRDSLMARLDRLSTVKETAQLAATLGREFTYELLQAVSPLDETTLQRDLERLVNTEFLYQKGLPPQARYIFKHALIQDAAYQSLLKSKRQQYHKQIAQILAERFQETAETEPELLAHHYTDAGLTAQAIPYWQKAGQRAMGRSAYEEAIGHLTKGIELLKTLPETPERIQQELTLQLALGGPLTATKGYAVPEVESTYARARELCQQVGETPQLIPVLFGLWRFYLQRAELQTARELGEQCLRLAQRLHDPASLLRAHNTLGVTLFYLGQFGSARAHLEQGITLYFPQQRRSLTFVQDPLVSCRAYAAWTLWHLGYPDQALQRSHEALALARELSHPFSLAQALFFVTSVFHHRREVRKAQEQAEMVISLSLEQGFPFWLSQGTMLRGWTLAQLGQAEEGIAQIRQGLASYQATGAQMGPPYYLALLAEAYGQVGQAEEGLALLAEALAAVHQSGERFYEAKLHQFKGELLLNAERVAKGKARPKQNTGQIHHSSFSIHHSAEECFHQAIAIARQQGAKSLELRAVMSLSRLWRQQGRKAEARQMLTEIYGWFTEGLGTPDLQEAKALLGELS